jgi:DNA-binding CsgD family transcriptional regulator
MSLEAHAHLALALHNPAQAARLYGAAQAMREAIGHCLPLLDRSDYSGFLQQLQRQLGPEAFQHAWQDGRALSYEQALSAMRAVTTSRPPAPRPEGEQNGDLPLGLTLREHEILRLVTAGLSNPEIGRQLYLSPHTVNNHLRSIYRKLNVSSRRAAGRVAQEYQLF